MTESKHETDVSARANTHPKACLSHPGLAPSDIESECKIFFQVLFERKELAKQAGLRWDNAARKWYAASAEIAAAFSNSFEPNVDVPVPTDRHYFNVPFLQRDRAKAIGMKFDGRRKLWFADGTDMAVVASSLFLGLANPNAKQVG
jgi:hypothetical protein